MFGLTRISATSAKYIRKTGQDIRKLKRALRKGLVINGCQLIRQHHLDGWYAPEGFYLIDRSPEAASFELYW